MARVDIDIDRVACVLEVWEREPLIQLVLDLIEAVPKTRRASVLGQHLPLGEIRHRSLREADLLREVRGFHGRAVSGEFFESFMVNSKNHMEMSKGTLRFIAEFTRLASSTARTARSGGHAEACEAFSLLLELHRRVDDVEDVIFLADEHGAWQIDCPWNDLLPDWFVSLTETQDPDAYAESVLSILATLVPYNADEMLTTARKVATPAQRRRLRGAKLRHR